MEKIKNTYRIIKPFINKYTIVISGFAILMSFGDYSFVKRFKLAHSVAELQKEKDQYEEAIVKAKAELKLLNNSKKNLEKLAREKYLMRKANEDVFLIPDIEENSTEELKTN